MTLYGRHASHTEDAARRRDIVPAFYAATKGATGCGPWKVFWQGLKGVEQVAAMAGLPRLLARPPTAEVVHFQWLALPVVDRRFLEALGRTTPLVLTLHDSTPFNGNAPSAMTRVGITRCFDAFHGIIVHTERARGRLLEQGCRPNASHSSSTACSGRRRLRRARTGWKARPAAPRRRSPSCFSALLFGKIRPYKGADVLIRAFGRLPAELR